MYNNYENPNRFGATINQNFKRELTPKVRRSNMRASIATILHRHGMSSEDIAMIMNESYEHYVMCNNTGIDVYNTFQKETGLNTI